MRHDVTLATLLSALAVIPPALIADTFLTADGAGATALARSPSQTAAQAAVTMTCTVRNMNTKSGALEVMTGVGHALRLVQIHVDAACQIKRAGARGSLEDLKPGNIVRVRYSPSSSGGPASRRVAQSIEILPPEGAGGGR